MSSSGTKRKKTGVAPLSSELSTELTRPRQFWLRFADQTVCYPRSHNRRAGVPLLVGPFISSTSAYNWGNHHLRAIDPAATVARTVPDERFRLKADIRSVREECAFTVHEGDYLQALAGENVAPWQPCDEYKPHESSHEEMYNAHQCMQCEVGTVRFCHNCMSDHHDRPEGWNKCAGQK